METDGVFSCNSEILPFSDTIQTPGPGAAGGPSPAAAASGRPGGADARGTIWSPSRPRTAQQLPAQPGGVFQANQAAEPPEPRGGEGEGAAAHPPPARPGAPRGRAPPAGPCAPRSPPTPNQITPRTPRAPPRPLSGSALPSERGAQRSHGRNFGWVGGVHVWITPPVSPIPFAAPGKGSTREPGAVRNTSQLPSPL